MARAPDPSFDCYALVLFCREKRRVKLWFFADGAHMVGCVDCSVEFARRLARLYNDDPTTTRPIVLIADNADPAHAGLRITTRGEASAPTS